MKQSSKLEKLRTAITNIALAYKMAWRISRKTFFFGLLDDVVLTNVITYTQLYLVQLLVDLITRASVGEEPNFVNKLLLLCFAVFFITLFSSVYSNYLTVFRQKMDAEANERMQNLIIRKAAVIKMEYFEQNDFYDRFNRARSMASRNTLRVFNYTNNFLSGLISAITAAVILFSNRIWIVGAVIVIESVYILLWIKMSDIVINETKINTPEMRKLDFLSGLFAQKSAIQDIKLNGSAAFLERKQNVLYQSIIKRKKEVGKKNLVIQMLVTFTEIFCKYGLYLLYAYRALRGLITPGQFTYLFGVSQNLMHMVRYATSMFGSLYDTALSVEDLNFILNCEEENLDGERLSPGFGGIEARNLRFTYPNSDRAVLENISLQIKPREKVCIVGPNGAGKTTLSKLLLGLYSDYEGELFYSGKDGRTLDKRSVYGLFTVAMQAYCKYPFSVRDNITLSDPSNIDENELSEAITKVDAEGFISALRDGCETMLNKVFAEDGTELSEGQWHRLALARALYRKREVLMFDEPSNSMDPLAEKHFMDTLLEQYDEHTVIIISHRLSCCVNVDKIIVMDKGRIVDIGSHTELMQRDGLYKTMFVTQASEYEEGHI